VPEITENKSDPDELNIVWGAASIAKLIGCSSRSVYHMAASGQLPAVKQVGRKLAASKRELLKLFEANAD
jgi:hypothetical protein